MRFENLEIHNVFDLTPRSDGEGVVLHRLPERVRLEATHGTFERERSTSGCELRFNLSGDATITIERVVTEWDPTISLLEVYHGDFQALDKITPLHAPPGRTSFTVRLPPNLETLVALRERDGLPFDPRLVRVFLPHECETHLISVSGEVTPPSADQTPQKRVFVYGSSITQGASAIRPTETYPELLARHLGWDVLSLGLSGAAMLESVVGEHIAAQNWDVAILETGVNVIDFWDEARFEAQLEAFLTPVVRTRRPVICTGVYTGIWDAVSDPRADAYREVVRRVVAGFGSPAVRFTSGRELLGFSGLSVDLVHPGTSGMHTLGHGLANAVRAHLRFLET
jgi:GDSL-like Lipase/Acylhydrolase family